MENRKISTRVLWMLLIIALINCLYVSAASAQTGARQKFKDMTPQQRADYQTGMMKSKLKLDTGQIVKVKALNLKYAEKFQPIIKSDESRFSKFKQAEKIQEQKDNELKNIFTPAQFKQYKDFESDMRKKMTGKVS